jgi:hypothetical protein
MRDLLRISEYLSEEWGVFKIISSLEKSLLCNMFFMEVFIFNSLCFSP